MATQRGDGRTVFWSSRSITFQVSRHKSDYYLLFCNV